MHIDESTLRPAPKIFKEDCCIDWNRNGKDIVNFVRGLSPYPAAWTPLSGEGVQPLTAKIFSAKFIPAGGESCGECGDIVSDGKNFIRVRCADGQIEIGELQIAGKKRMAVKELLLGFREISKYSAR